VWGIITQSACAKVGDLVAVAATIGRLAEIIALRRELCPRSKPEEVLTGENQRCSAAPSTGVHNRYRTGSVGIRDNSRPAGTDAAFCDLDLQPAP